MKMVEKIIQFEGKSFNLTKRHVADVGKTSISKCKYVQVVCSDADGIETTKFAAMNAKYREILSAMEVAT